MLAITLTNWRLTPFYADASYFLFSAHVVNTNSVLTVHKSRLTTISVVGKLYTKSDVFNVI